MKIMKEGTVKYDEDGKLWIERWVFNLEGKMTTIEEATAFVLDYLKTKQCNSINYNYNGNYVSSEKIGEDVL